MNLGVFILVESFLCNVFLSDEWFIYYLCLFDMIVCFEGDNDDEENCFFVIGYVVIFIKFKMFFRNEEYEELLEELEFDIISLVEEL